MDKSWMHADRRSEKYELGVEELLRMGLENAVEPNLIHCPCIKCGNTKKLSVTLTREHLYFNGVDETYAKWIWHGESIVNDKSRSVNKEPNLECDIGWETKDMCEGAYEMFSENPDKFKEFVEDAERPLYPGCETYTKLSALIRLYNTKAKHGMTDACFSDILDDVASMLPRGQELPSSMYEAKKTLSALGLKYEKIHACENNCILYRKKYQDATSCPKCGLSRWKITKDMVEQKGVPVKVVWYFPPIPRLRRLFRSSDTSKHLTWHADHRIVDGQLRHPADSPSWKLVDQMWPEFGCEPRNIRLALSADGINPHSIQNSKHSCWPVILVVYNLPPSMCMKRKFMMLNMLIPGKKQPGNAIDVYLELLVDDLKELWDGIEGVYDSYRQESFTLKGVLLWTINDFPAYGNLSGCTTHGYFACPVCGEDTYAIHLEHGRKMSFTGHRRFLPRHHPYRKMTKEFNGKEELAMAPKPLTGEQVFERVAAIKCEFGKKMKVHCRAPKKQKIEVESKEEKKEDENKSSKLWKKKSVFFDLPYWKHLHVRHCLDVMHIEKNVCEALFGTLLNIKGKTKDTLAARLDLVKMGVRTKLAPNVGEKRSFLPAASCTLKKEEKISVCKALLGIKVPEGYSSNIKSLVCMQELKLSGLKSHDCHVLMQQLLPVVIRAVLPKHVRFAIMRFCFFFNDLCTKVVDVPKLDKIQSDLVTTLCMLEQFFPPSFFDIMIHLTVHLIREVRLCGPVYFRWMYPFERYMKVLKGYVGSRKHPEASIAERYIVEEAAEFCSEYMAELSPIGIPIAHMGEAKTYGTNSKPSIQPVPRDQLEQAHKTVLNNTSEVDPYINAHKTYLKQSNPKKANDEKWIQDAHNRSFINWFRVQVAAEIGNEDGEIMQTLTWLAQGPRIGVLKYDDYIVNGVHYHTKLRDSERAVQNSGVCLVASTMQVCSAKDKNPVVSNMTFYGVIEEIWELNYHQFQVPLFKCAWVENEKGIISKDEFGFTLVNLNRRGHKKDEFVMANQVKQVFYVDDPLNHGWSVVLATPNRVYSLDDDLRDIILDHQSFTQGLPSVDEFAYEIAEGEEPYMRSDCDGFWVPNGKK